MTSAQTWRSRTVVRASPQHVIDTLTDPSACVRWSPIPFSLDPGGPERLRPGSRTAVSGRFLGARIRFDLRTLAADTDRLQLHASGPVDLHVHYALKPTRTGCALDAVIALDPPGTRRGRLLARTIALLLATGALDHAVDGIADEAERAAARSTAPRRRSGNAR